MFIQTREKLEVESGWLLFVPAAAQRLPRKLRHVLPVAHLATEWDSLIDLPPEVYIRSHLEKR